MKYRSDAENMAMLSQTKASLLESFTKLMTMDPDDEILDVEFIKSQKLELKARVLSIDEQIKHLSSGLRKENKSNDDENENEIAGVTSSVPNDDESESEYDYQYGY
mmetsp:Transcript_5036/g.6359  ORF Transcript_5036/g.6359 Transcript_5036/m.6359 type:complete len:106 (-) Transcript_5036:1289-1606(-)